jgi:hypothetical protein
VLVLAGALALGASSQAAASGDPVSIWTCTKGGCYPQLSSSQLTGPQLGDLVCTPTSEVSLPLPLWIVGQFLPPGPEAGPNETVYVCKQ